MKRALNIWDQHTHLPMLYLKVRTNRRRIIPHLPEDLLFMAQTSQLNMSPVRRAVVHLTSLMAVNRSNRALLTRVQLRLVAYKPFGKRVGPLASILQVTVKERTSQEHGPGNLDCPRTCVCTPSTIEATRLYHNAL